MLGCVLVLSATSHPSLGFTSLFSLFNVNFKGKKGSTGDLEENISCVKFMTSNQIFSNLFKPTETN